MGCVLSFFNTDLPVLYSGEVGDARGVSVSTNGNRVADIRPLGRIQTVQVEVEPNETEVTEDDGDSLQSRMIGAEAGSGEESREEGMKTEGESGGEIIGEGRVTGREDFVEETRGSQVQRSSPTPPPTTQPQLMPVQQLAGPTGEKSALGPGRLSPHSLPTVAEGLQEAGTKRSLAGKKSKKSKALSTKDLLPLHQDVGRSNKQLLEPATPEFKPTAEWVHVP